MLKDMMPHFDLYQPDSVDAAVSLAGQLGGEGWVVAGGQDSFDCRSGACHRPVR